MKYIKKFRQWLNKPRNALAAGAALLIASGGVIAFAVFYGGYAIGRYEIGPFELAQRAEFKFFGERFASARKASIAADWPSTARHIDSIFVDLETDIGRAPVERDGAGGGMTSFGDAVVLVTHEGGIFAVRSGDSITRTSIAAPENGFDAYKAAALGELSDHYHNLGYFRFNDILHYQSDSVRGLAVSYTEWNDQEGCYGTAVAILPIDASVEKIEDVEAGADDWRVIFRTQPCLPPKKVYRAIEGHTAGGRIAFRAPDVIVLGSGDYSWDGIYAPEAIAQDPSNDYGKIIEINMTTGESVHLSTGHRNTQGVAFDKDGGLWVVEHGHRGGDELNSITKGANHGWPLETLGTRYSGLPIPGTVSYGRHETYKRPVFAWLPSIATSSLTAIEGFHESWDGDLLLGGLNSQSLYRVRIIEGRVLFDEKIPVGQRVRYVHQHTDGRIVFWTDDEYVVFLTPSKEDATMAFIARHISRLDVDESIKAQTQEAVNNCMQCHSFRPDEHYSAPGLGGIAGAAIGGTPFAGYSSAMTAASGIWTKDALLAYLDDPAQAMPGTLMPDPGVDNPEVRREIVNLLDALHNKND